MTDIIGLILAGGQGHRLGSSGKAGIRLGSETLLERAIARLGPQCTPLLLNLGPDMPDPLANLPVVRDAIGSFEGPLAGVLAGLDWVAEHSPQTRFVLTVPVDSPFLPQDLCVGLQRAQRDTGDVVIARSGGRDHPLHAIWPVKLRDDLRAYLANGTSRKVGAFQANYIVRHAEWDIGNIDPFFNINTAADLAQATEFVTSHPISEGFHRMPIHTLNLHGLKCPLPVLKTQKALATLPPGSLIQVECTDPLAAIDIPSFAQQAGHRLDSFEALSGGTLIFRIRKADIAL